MKLIGEFNPHNLISVVLVLTLKLAGVWSENESPSTNKVSEQILQRFLHPEDIQKYLRKVRF